MSHINEMDLAAEIDMAVENKSNGESTDLQTVDIEIPLGLKSRKEILSWMRSHSTPLEMIDVRKGRGGKEFYYLRHQYVTQVLNRITMHNWDFEVLRERMDTIPIADTESDPQITVLGKLTIRVGDHTIIKTQFGSSDVKTRTDNNEPLSIGDDFKSAASDSLKKCASLLGLGMDLSMPISLRRLRHLHAVGTRAFGDKWDEKREFSVRCITGGQETSASELTEAEARVLIAIFDALNEDKTLDTKITRHVAHKMGMTQ